MQFVLLFASATAAPTCASTGQGYACHESAPNFAWQPPHAAPLPDPLLAGNSTVLFLRSVSSLSCATWFPSVEKFLTARLTENRFLSIAAPYCGGTIDASGALVPPAAAADRATLLHITALMTSRAISTTPVLRIASAATVRALIADPGSVARLAAALARDASANAYGGYHLALNLSLVDDDAQLGACLAACGASLAPLNRVISVEIASARRDATLARALASMPGGSSVIVRVVASTSTSDFAAFDAAVAAAAAQFAPHGVALSVGLSLAAGAWWGGTGRPSIVDVVQRRGALPRHNIAHVSLDVDWESAAFRSDQSRLDLIQLALFAPFRGGIGMPWETLAPPADGSRATRDAWGTAVAAWRNATRAALGFDGGAAARNASALPYDVPALAEWTQRNWVSPQVMLHDRLLFDRTLGGAWGGDWTVQRWMDDASARWGPVDSVLLWHSYPNIGVDDRSQFAMAESLPGGLVGLKALVAEFHGRGVRVMLPYNPWDTGTAKEPGYSGDAAALTALIEEVGADGFNGDTMFGIDESFYAPSVKAGRPIALQPECSADARAGSRAPPDSPIPGVYGAAHGLTLAQNPLSWAYFGYLPPGRYPCANASATCPGGVLDSVVPMSSKVAGVGPPLVSRYRQLESRHMAQICERWATARRDGLHHAFLNGMGYVPWENGELFRFEEEIRTRCSLAHAHAAHPLLPRQLQRPSQSGASGTRFRKETAPRCGARCTRCATSMAMLSAARSSRSSQHRSSRESTARASTESL